MPDLPLHPQNLHVIDRLRVEARACGNDAAYHHLTQIGITSVQASLAHQDMCLARAISYDLRTATYTACLDDGPISAESPIYYHSIAEATLDREVERRLREWVNLPQAYDAISHDVAA